MGMNVRKLFFAEAATATTTATATATATTATTTHASGLILAQDLAARGATLFGPRWFGGSVLDAAKPPQTKSSSFRRMNAKINK